MLKGFKDFIMRGNVIELAIGVVIGVAFQAVVSGANSAPVVVVDLDCVGVGVAMTSSHRLFDGRDACCVMQETG